MMQKKIAMNLILSAALALAATGAGWAQTSTQGAIGGTVFDTTGAIVSNASVTIHNDGTNAEIHLTSDDSGYFKAPLLEPGSYTVTVSAPSFGEVRVSKVTV
jgi:hypothetical protein